MDSKDKLDRPLFFEVRHSVFDSVHNSRKIIWWVHAVCPDIFYIKTKIYVHLHYKQCKMSVQAVRNTTKYLFNSVDGKLLSTTCFGPQVAIIRLALFGNLQLPKSANLMMAT
jgi:hypothetical protein